MLKGYIAMRLKDISIVEYFSGVEKGLPQFSEDFSEVYVIKDKQAAKNISEEISGAVMPYY